MRNWNFWNKEVLPSPFAFQKHFHKVLQVSEVTHRIKWCWFWAWSAQPRVGKCLNFNGIAHVSDFTSLFLGPILRLHGMILWGGLLSFSQSLVDDFYVGFFFFFFSTDSCFFRPRSYKEAWFARLSSTKSNVKTHILKMWRWQKFLLQ